MSIRVLVADDQSMVRAGFRMLLSGESDIEVVAEASNGIEAVQKAARFHPTVVLMDIRMPELDGLEATRGSSPRIDLPFAAVAQTGREHAPLGLRHDQHDRPEREHYAASCEYRHEPAADRAMRIAIKGGL